LQSVDLLVAQRDAFAPAIATLARRRATDDPVEMWRRESARAVGRFLDTALRRARRAASSGAAEPDLRSVSQRR
jgi:hypothetical protein